MPNPSGSFAVLAGFLPARSFRDCRVRQGRARPRTRCPRRIQNPSRAACWGFSLCATACQVALLRFGVEYGESLLPDKGQADLLRPAGSAFPPSMAVTCDQEPVRSAAGVAKRDKQESQTERSSGLIVGHRNRRLICCIQKPR